MFRGLLTATVLQPVKRAARLPSPRLRPAVWQELGDRQEGAGAWANLGTVYLDQGDLNRAEQEQAKYLRMARDLGDRDSECRALGNLGNVQRARGQYEAATERYGEALSLARELRNPLHEIATLRRIASVQAQ